jgi:hypothetical protein
LIDSKSKTHFNKLQLQKKNLGGNFGKSFPIHRKGQQATLGFMQVGLTNKSSTICKSQLQFQRTNNYQLLYLTSTIYFNKQRLSADGMLIPNLHKALLVACHYTDTLCV